MWTCSALLPHDTSGHACCTCYNNGIMPLPPTCASAAYLCQPGAAAEMGVQVQGQVQQGGVHSQSTADWWAAQRTSQPGSLSFAPLALVAAAAAAAAVGWQGAAGWRLPACTTAGLHPLIIPMPEKMAEK